MPIQAPQWTDYLNCPVCCREFGTFPRSPISLSCGHTICKYCIGHLHRRQCPFDQTVLSVDPEDMVVNTALLQLAGYPPPAQPYRPAAVKALPEPDRLAYDVIVRRMEELATYLKYCATNTVSGNRLSRPMQRKLVTLIQCSVADEEGRGRAAKAARSLGERTVTELILQHQNPQQLSANLWAAVRARGCQFLGPAMQEEVLKLVLLALEDGSALSRKVLVMFVVQRLEPHFPQASKTSIGHVVQLLYRASCFKVSKRECDSSLMQLKEEFRSYESLRREHDAQIVQIATEAGLRIAPDQWSSLLYGDTAHKSHMQSIIDKLQSPQSFAQSIEELLLALHRTGDPTELLMLSVNFQKLAVIDASPDAPSPSWQQLMEILTSLNMVVSMLIPFSPLRDNNQNHRVVERTENNNPVSVQPAAAGSTPGRYKVAMCWDATKNQFCPRGPACTFAHSEEELERYQSTQSQDTPATMPEVSPAEGEGREPRSQLGPIGSVPYAAQTYMPNYSQPPAALMPPVPPPPPFNTQQVPRPMPHVFTQPPPIRYENNMEFINSQGQPATPASGIYVPNCNVMHPMRFPPQMCNPACHVANLVHFPPSHYVVIPTSNISSPPPNYSDVNNAAMANCHPTPDVQNTVFPGHPTDFGQSNSAFTPAAPNMNVPTRNVTPIFDQYSFDPVQSDLLYDSFRAVGANASFAPPPNRWPTSPEVPHNTEPSAPAMSPHAFPDEQYYMSDAQWTSHHSVHSESSHSEEDQLEEKFDELKRLMDEEYDT